MAKGEKFLTEKIEEVDKELEVLSKTLERLSGTVDFYKEESERLRRAILDFIKEKDQTVTLESITVDDISILLKNKDEFMKAVSNVLRKHKRRF